MKLLVLDNYDSFTYNLVYMLRKHCSADDVVDVFRNDEISLEDVDQYDKILLSPGPSLPDDAGIMKALIQSYAPSKSILGVCLGHQGIVEVFGGKLRNLVTVLHGYEGKLEVLTDDQIFENVPSGSTIGQYHSWTADEATMPDCLQVTAKNLDGLIMAVAHKEYDVKGLQFHPESIMTAFGNEIIKNWLKERNKIQDASIKI